MTHSIGLTGGIGSGKSTVAGILKHMGYAVYIADTEASRLINRSVEIRNELTSLFGADLYTPQGVLDKKILADIIFKNPQALSQVNRIVHPRVISDFRHWRKQQNSNLVFFESAILFEAGLTRYFDFIICVTAPQAIRLKRVVLRDATNEDKVKERMQNQADDAEKCRNSDFIIYNDEEHMVVQQVLDILNKLNLKYNKQSWQNTENGSEQG